MLRISAIRLGLNIVPPHVFLAFGKGPRGLAGHRAALATDAAVKVENKGKLLARKCRFIGEFHLAAQLPIIHSAHGFFGGLQSYVRSRSAHGIKGGSFVVSSS